MFYVYVLKSFRNDYFYIGSTRDLEKRIERHNRGMSRFTRPYRPFELVYSEVYNTRAEAVRREKQIKSYKGGAAFQQLIRK